MGRLRREGAVVEGLEECVGAEDGDGGAEARKHVLDILALPQPRVHAPDVVRAGEHGDGS